MQNLIVVLGMHRSGTSTITRSLPTMGVNLGDHLMPALPGNNDKGFWEDVDVNALNVDALKFLNSDWHFLSALSTADLEKLDGAGFVARASDLIGKKLDSFLNFGLKDPRITKLLPFWKVVFQNIGCKVSYVIAVRNPLSVAASLKRRDEIPTEKSLYLWLEHTLISLNQARSARCVVVDYDRLMSLPKNELCRVSEHLGLSLNETLVNEYIDEFLDEALRHSHVSNLIATEGDDFKSLVNRTYRLALRVASDELAVGDAEFSVEVERLFSDYKKYSYFSKFIDKQTSDITHLSAIVSDQESRVASLTSEIASLTSKVASLNDEKTDLATRVNELLNSASWRVTAPLRAASRWLYDRI